MTILTKSEAESVTKYYSEILIGKPITPPGDSNALKISSLETSKLDDGYVVRCVCNVSGKIFHSSLEKAILNTNVLPLEEFLSNLN
jgi:hypothetical protein